MDAIPTPAFAVPYAAPRLQKTRADDTPIKPVELGEGGQGMSSFIHCHVSLRFPPAFKTAHNAPKKAAEEGHMSTAA